MVQELTIMNYRGEMQVYYKLDDLSTHKCKYTHDYNAKMPTV